MQLPLVRHPPPAHGRGMFIVDESTAAAIRQAYAESGELSAMVELRRHFPGIADMASARRCVQIIAGWQPRSPDAAQLAQPRRTRPPRQRPAR